MHYAFIFLALFTQSVFAQTLAVPTYSTTTAEAIIRAHAVHYGVNGDDLVATLKCESGFKADAVGDHGNSYGIAQIFLAAHTEITKEQALDPMWAIDWTARQFSKGNARLWTCFRNLKNGEVGG